MNFAVGFGLGFCLLVTGAIYACYNKYFVGKSKEGSSVGQNIEFSNVATKDYKENVDPDTI